MHVLIIEDDLDLGFALQNALKAEGISSEWLRRVADAPLSPDAAGCDCALLDVTLPDGSGFDLLARWRRAGCLLPVIIITARAGLDERLRGLDGGADDFLVKPFATAELVSRLRAVSRRYAGQAGEAWIAGDLRIDVRRHTAELAGEKLELSPREFHLLLELTRDAGRVVQKGRLAQRLEPLGEPLDFGALEVHIFNLRRKIGASRIRTVRGVGYLLQQ